MIPVHIIGSIIAHSKIKIKSFFDFYLSVRNVTELEKRTKTVLFFCIYYGLCKPNMLSLYCMRVYVSDVSAFAARPVRHDHDMIKGNALI